MLSWALGLGLGIFGSLTLFIYYALIFLQKTRFTFFVTFLNTVVLITAGGLMLFDTGATKTNFQIVDTQSLTHGQLTAMAYSENQGLLTGYHGNSRIFEGNRVYKDITDFTAYSGLDVVDEYLFVVDFDQQTLLVYKNALFWRQYQNLSFHPIGLTASQHDIFVTGVGPSKEILILKNYTDKTCHVRENLKYFGTNDSFTTLRGLVFADGLLYVCDHHRILIFSGKRKIRELGPFADPRQLVFWNTRLVVASHLQTLLLSSNMDTIDFIIHGPSYHVAASKTRLYIGDTTHVRSYKSS